MAYRQPRVPEYREGDGIGQHMKKLGLFLKDFVSAAWTANNRRMREIQALSGETERMNARIAALEAERRKGEE